MMPPAGIDIIFNAPGWPDDLASLIRNALETALKVIAPDLPGPAEICVVLDNDDAVQALNRNYRGKDKPTNVLSFPQYDPALPLPPGAPCPLGDIILAYETVAREAAEARKSLADHTIHLVVHGFLHLLGWDHETEDEARAMEEREIALLAQLGIKNPYDSSQFVP